MSWTKLASGVWQLGAEVVKVDYEQHGAPIEWASVFGREGPLALEIGAGSGEFLTRMARENPDLDHVAIEFKHKRVEKFARRIRKSGLTNVRVISGEASQLISCLFTPEALCAVYFLFPDPWPKKRHHKHRFLNRYTLEILHDLLRRGGLLHLATDHPSYLDWMRETVSHHTGFEGPTYEDSQSPFGFPTRYEQYWLAENRPITYMSYRRCDAR